MSYPPSTDDEWLPLSSYSQPLGNDFVNRAMYTNSTASLGQHAPRHQQSLRRPATQQTYTPFLRPLSRAGRNLAAASKPVGNASSRRQHGSTSHQLSTSSLPAIPSTHRSMQASTPRLSAYQQPAHTSRDEIELDQHTQQYVMKQQQHQVTAGSILHEHKTSYSDVVPLRPSRPSSTESRRSVGSSHSHNSSHPSSHSHNSSHPRTRKISTDSSLLHTMTQRLLHLEQQCLQYQHTIAEQEQEIIDLTSSTVEELVHDNQRLQHQVAEMEKFLADYDLTWVGASTPRLSAAETHVDVTSSQPSAPHYRPSHTPKSSSSHSISLQGVDFDKLIKCIEELNQQFRSEPPPVRPVAAAVTSKPRHANIQSLHTKQNNNATSSHQSPSIQLYLYLNGLQLAFNAQQRGIYRAYTQPDTKALLTDLLDGYLPSELRLWYPNGVTIDVVDKRTVEYDAVDATSDSAESNAKFRPFVGQGNVLRRRSSRVAVIDEEAVREQLNADAAPAMPTVVNAVITSAPATAVASETAINKATAHVPVRLNFHIAQKQTAEQLLAKLPSKTVCNGQLIDVRDSLAQQIQSPIAAKSSIELPKANSITVDTCALHCRFDAALGGKSLLVTLKPSDCITDLRKMVDEHLAASKQANAQYEIRSAYPARVHKLLNVTLSDAGLVPNATLLVRSV